MHVLIGGFLRCICTVLTDKWSCVQLVYINFTAGLLSVCYCRGKIGVYVVHQDYGSSSQTLALTGPTCGGFQAFSW